MINRIIEFSAQNKFIVFLLTAAASWPDTAPIKEFHP
jgi:hypothetical protein